MTDIPGIHHVTAICGDPQTNVDFYAGALGLRFVKRTVNFDDPTTYHLYYGDELGRPGTALTFFAWPQAGPGRPGTGQVTEVAFRVPAESLDGWEERLAAHGVAAERAGTRFGAPVLAFPDPDGLRLALVGAGGLADEDGSLWREGPVPPEHALRGFHGVTLTEEGDEATAELLEDLLGYERAGEEEGLHRFRAPAAERDEPGGFLEIAPRPDVLRGRVAVGSVHHVAFRAPDGERQLARREALVRAGLNVTPVIDRLYFRSIYFREPGGVLFEIATDSPGFTADEEPERLGSALRLPPWLERHREEIQAALPPLEAPRVPAR